MEVIGNTLFSIVGSTVKAYDINSGSQLSSVTIVGANFLNGMASDGVNRVWVTDFGTNKIMEIDYTDLQNPSYSTVVSNTTVTPNGICYDADNNRLVFVAWSGNTSDITAVSLSDYSLTTLVANASLNSIDGIDNDNVDLTLAQWQALGFVEALTPADVQTLDDLFDTIDWTIAVDASTATTNGQAALAALRVVVAPRSGEEPAPAASATPTPSPTPTATATPAPRPTATPAPSVTRKPVPQPSPSQTPVYVDAPEPGDGIQEVAPGVVAAVVDSVDQQPVVEIVEDVTMRITLPQGIQLALSSILTDGKPAKIADDGALIVVQGTTVQVSGSGFAPNSVVDVWIYSTPTQLGTVTTDAQGAFTATFDVPSSIPAGDHTIKVDGKTSAGELSTVSFGVRVLPKSQEASVDTVNPSPTATNSAGLSESSSLMNSTTGMVLGAILLLLLLGFFLIAARRRRNAAH
jgi:hypothetical protein